MKNVFVVLAVMAVNAAGISTVTQAQDSSGRVYLTSQVHDDPAWTLKEVDSPLTTTKVVAPPIYSQTPLKQILSQTSYNTEAGCTTDAGCTTGPGCTDAGCQTGCATEGCNSCSVDCNPRCVCRHRTKIFGEFLLLSAGNVDFRHAQAVDGPTDTAVPVGRGGLLQPNHSPGFRVGAARAISCDTSVFATFWNFQSSTTSQLNAPGGRGTIRSLTTHPNTEQVDTDSLNASGLYDIDFRNIDVGMQKLIQGDCAKAVNGSFGLRYAHLSQDFQGDYIINGATRVNSEIDFNGVGPRMGLDMTSRVGCGGWRVYSTGAASLLLGNFSADFRQHNVFDQVQAVDGYDDYRIVPVLDLELGLRHVSQDGRFSFGAGYLISAWFNTMTTPGFIDSVHRSDFDEVNETLIFDGLTARAEFRY